MMIYQTKCCVACVLIHEPLSSHLLKNYSMNMSKFRLLLTVVISIGAIPLMGQIKLTPFVGYTIQDKVYGYYGDMTIGDGMHFGGTLSKEMSSQMSVDLTYSYQSTSFGLKDYSSITNNLSGTYKGSVSYLMLGSTHSPDFTAKVAPYAGVMVGAAIFSSKEIISEKWKFAVGLKLGAIVHVNDKIGIVLQTQLMVPVQGIGVYFGTGGAGVSTSSSATQLGFTGGVEIKLGN